MVRTCPVCDRSDESNRHVFYNPRGDDRALHRECCRCELCIEELNQKELTNG